ncbi:MAG: trimethylamine methyltransferase family protein [Kiloniellales bacterium]
MEVQTEETGRRRGRSARRVAPAARVVNYRQLHHPFKPQAVFSEDAVQRMHDLALKALEELGIKILHEGARAVFAKAGARVDDEGQMVMIGRDIIEEALRTAPKSWRLRAANPERETDYALGSMLFAAGAGCPNVTDAERGRRPGTIADFEETIKLQQSFDVIHKHGPSVEPQDVPVVFRHYAMTVAQLAYGDKPYFIYSRGQQQVEESLEMIQLGLGLSADDFADGVWATTIINTNSPRQIDIPMAQGIMDFARHRQMSVITPFCLSGAMAPVTVGGALMLQHAEALAAIALAQLVQPGAPVSYGGFSSNVDMKSGAPAFGTPEHIKLTIGTGQLARLIGLPWRSASGSASNVADMQSAQETQMGNWAALMANATLTVHAAGWLEGGLSFGYEKFINDIESLQTLAELCVPPPDDEESLGFSALAEVDPGGHFFAAEHTMSRFAEAFYEPLIADLSNFGAWTEAGSLTSTDRSIPMWKQVLEQFQPPEHAAEALERVAGYVEAGKARGGAKPPE